MKKKMTVRICHQRSRPGEAGRGGSHVKSRTNPSRVLHNDLPFCFPSSPSPLERLMKYERKWLLAKILRVDKTVIKSAGPTPNQRGKRSETIERFFSFLDDTLSERKWITALVILSSRLLVKNFSVFETVYLGTRKGKKDRD